MPGWLLKDGGVLSSAEFADTLSARSRGFLGRSDFDGAMVFPRTRSVHSFGMGRSLDVAFCTVELEVVATTVLVPWRVALPRRRGRVVLEAPAGSFERWGLGCGDRLELRYGS